MGSLLGWIQYLVHTIYPQQPEEATVATYADDTAIMALGDSVTKATKKLQRTVQKSKQMNQKMTN